MSGMGASSSTSEPVQDLLRAFSGLTEPDQRDFLTEILRRAHDLELPPLDEETICQIADAAFLEYDIREAADAQSRPE